jgi:hypothetical protein
MKVPLIVMKFRVSKNLSLQKGFKICTNSYMGMMSNGKMFNMKAVGNFILILIDIQFFQNGDRMLSRHSDI